MPPRISVAVAIVAVAFASAAPLRAQDTPAALQAPSQPLQKTIGQRTQSGPVPSLFVLNARGATLADGKLTLTGASPNSIVFSDRPIRAAGHIETRRTPPSPSSGPTARSRMRW